MFWELITPRADLFASLSPIVDRHLRSPTFLRPMQYAFPLLHSPTYFVFPFSSPLRRRVSR